MNNNNNLDKINIEKSNMFSFGLILLRILIFLEDEKIIGLNKD